eukprot:gene27846-7208_t
MYELATPEDQGGGSNANNGDEGGRGLNQIPLQTCPPSSNSMRLAGSERLPYHRFCAPLKSHDYMLADDDIDFVVQPPLPTIEGESMVGVSFFAPIDLLGTAAHAYYQRRAPDSECYNVDRNKFLPDGVDFHQDTMLVFMPELPDHPLYPNCFQSMSNNRKGKKHVHGLHFSLYPTQRMEIKALNAKVEELRHLRCPMYELATLEDQGGGNNANNGDEGGGWLNQFPLKTCPPSSNSMRLVCEALHAHSGSSSTSPNEALMCYLLLHDIGARDSPLNTLLYDSWRSRLVYKALCGYDTETCAISNAGGVWAGMRPLLEAVLPSYIHVSDDTDDEDGDKDGIDGTSSERGDMEPAPETVELDGGETNQASGELAAFECKASVVII